MRERAGERPVRNRRTRIVTYPIMPQETVVYLVNLILGAIVAGLMTQHWRASSHIVPIRYWIVAAWTLTAADALFAIRPMMPHMLARTLPTLMVTAGHAVLLFATRRTAGLSPQLRPTVALVAVHALLLVTFLAVPSLSSWRTVVNSVVWSGLSLAAAVTLQRAAPEIRRTMLLPALVLAAQGVFHIVRLLLATRAAMQPADGLRSLVQLLGDLEVSLFMVALFVSVLVAFLQQSNLQLQLALDNVRQLSSMLPVCAWCEKIRDDRGYWTRIEEFLAAHRVSVTHSICESCAAQNFPVGSGMPGPGADPRA